MSLYSHFYNVHHELYDCDWRRALYSHFYNVHHELYDCDWRRALYSHFYLATSYTDVFCDDNIAGVNRRHHGGACALHV